MTRRVSPVDNPDLQLIAILRAEERLIDAALRLAAMTEREEHQRGFPISEMWTETEFRRAAKALRKARKK